MSRSIKKGPYVAESLMKKITALNEANDKKVVKGHAGEERKTSLK